MSRPLPVMTSIQISSSSSLSCRRWSHVSGTASKAAATDSSAASMNRSIAQRRASSLWRCRRPRWSPGSRRSRSASRESSWSAPGSPPSSSTRAWRDPTTSRACSSSWHPSAHLPDYTPTAPMGTVSSHTSGIVSLGRCSPRPTSWSRVRCPTVLHSLSSLICIVVGKSTLVRITIGLAIASYPSCIFRDLVERTRICGSPVAKNILRCMM